MPILSVWLFTEKPTFPGAAPNDSATACMADEDGDDYGADDAPTGGVAGTDCNDEIDTIKPGVPETCDGTDIHCSGDESDASTTDEACEAPTDYVADNADCDDANDTLTNFVLANLIPVRPRPVWRYWTMDTIREMVLIGSIQMRRVLLKRIAT